MPGSKLRWITGLLFLALLALPAGGCTGRYADPGPEPVRVKVSFQASAGKALVQSALEDNQLVPPIVLPGIFHEVHGPYWDWGLYLVGRGESFTPLKPLGAQPTKFIRADSLSAAQTFAAPPGKVRLHLLVECYLEHTWSEGLGPTQSQSVAVSQFTRQWDLDLKPGGGYEMSLGPLGRPDK